MTPMPKRFETKIAQWRQVEPLFSADHSARVTALPDRTMFNGILWIMQTGEWWDVLPPRYGDPHALQKQFEIWLANGTLKKAIDQLKGQPGMEWVNHPTALIRVE
ncbi:transposase [Lentilactobacillus raoultii]|uniref:Transposase n=1 Tax=Lentilactobacillus raoultii TaxID=1987503 RepID=A0ABW3PEQ8_9LACO|nr:transposase [Lentilactobacillus raoultii]